MAIVGKLAEQIAAGAGLVPVKRRPIGHPTFWCWGCDQSWLGTACPDDPTHDGIKHGSEDECEWYQALLVEARAGFICDVRPHPVFILPGNIRYTADAEWWTPDGVHCVGEYKSKYTAKGREWRRTKKQFIALYPDLRLVEVIE